MIYLRVFSIINDIYNHMVLMSLRSRSHVMASMVLMRTDHLFIQNYIRSLLYIILRPRLMVRMEIEHSSNLLCI